MNKWLMPVFFLYFLGTNRINVFPKLFNKGCNNPSVANRDIHAFFCPQYQSGCKVCKCISYLVGTPRNLSLIHI